MLTSHLTRNEESETLQSLVSFMYDWQNAIKLKSVTKDIDKQSYLIT
jgi:hypothetical protein